MSPAARRATGLVLLGVVVAVACTFLGRWQWNRHVWRDAAIAVVETNWSADPVPLDTVLPATDTPLTDDDVWRRVTVVGHYEPDATVLLRNRPVDGAPAYHVLVPFVVEDASAGTAADPHPGGHGARRRPRLGGPRRGRERRRRRPRAARGHRDAHGPAAPRRAGVHAGPRRPARCRPSRPSRCSPPAASRARPTTPTSR